MRRLTEPQAHRERLAVIEGDYPEGMEARCGLCGRRQQIRQGQLLERRRNSHEASRVFVCSVCLKARAA
ncbi:MAG: hypothetical protein ABR505_07415 [Actinomycetota bacterium]